MQALIVEDDVRLASALARILNENGYVTDVVHDGQDGYDYASSGIYDIVILDVMLPRKNGCRVVEELRRARIDTPVLMLTARSEIPDKIEGLDSGADDYMTKPFSPAELLAHLRALTRRQGQVVFERIEAGDLSLNIDSRDLSCNGKSIALSFKEFELARILFSNPGQIVSKDTLISKVWGVESTAVDNNVEAYVSFLRKKIRFLGSGVSIDTIRKAGYRVNLGDDDARSA
ncbi:response regulator transcription factor [Slackia exigua]|uniref:Response regulator receiver domain protein n=1 Tax=Slackia exigua (strain ATCC 700122 / DSM 15923 / CIP 105133 / JCM 11022 / KCTC 5966 / S-7) TaxID=649764 RepID=D0WEH1_SLAES|nr:response regulator transcription factor [Slackia exigua]EEZ62109.1 response regulator receiver domain protein [Slackia exigua ATCC 700122]STN98586.1 Transcriptional regulatory protein tcrA [Slackia exigua]